MKNLFAFIVVALVCAGCVHKDIPAKPWDSEAAKWLKSAAEDGVVYARYCYAVCCLYGDGVEQNREEAIKYLKLAADAGYSDAQELLLEINAGENVISK